MIIKASPKEYSWIKYIKGRILKKKNFLCLISGPTGSGKSWTCLSIALMLDKKFNEKRIIFGLKGLMKLINSDENFPAGTVFIWDEFQIDAGNRSWQSLTNKLLNSLLSTFRHKQFILLINAPYSDFIDSQTKKLLHAEMEVVNLDFETEKTKLKPMCIQYNSRKKKFYYKYLRIKTKRGIVPITSWGIPKPPKWITESYERKKESFTNSLNRKIETQLARLEEKEVGTSKPLTEKQQEVYDLMCKYDDVELVAKEIGISSRSVYFHIEQARKKGYNHEKIKKNSGVDAGN